MIGKIIQDKLTKQKYQGIIVDEKDGKYQIEFQYDDMYDWNTWTRWRKLEDIEILENAKCLYEKAK